MRRGSLIAEQIIQDMRREQYWKNKVTRQKCYIDNEKQCNKCMYKEICDSVEREEENQ